jgi:hypothetical protein
MKGLNAVVADCRFADEIAAGLEPRRLEPAEEFCGAFVHTLMLTCHI